MIERRVAAFVALAFATVAVAPGCLPPEDCTTTATCPPPETDAAAIDALQSKDGDRFDSSRVTDSSTANDAILDTAWPSDDPLPTDSGAAADAALLNDVPPGADAQPSGSTDAQAAVDGPTTFDGQPRADAQSSLDAQPRADAQSIVPADSGAPDCAACQDAAALVCGDGVVSGGEQCDNGKAANLGAYGGCNADCTLAPRCGDSIRNGSEVCDDGNKVDTDGCTTTCQCGAGTKLCNGSCIANSACCTNAECGANGTCTSVHACQCAGTSTLCASACVDTSGDPTNCGTCGHSCLGGSCQSGVCLPVAIGSSPTVVQQLAVNATTVFTASAPDQTNVIVYGVPKTTPGTTPPTLNTIITVPGGVVPSIYIAASDSLLMFAITTTSYDEQLTATDSTTLYSCNPAQCVATLKTWFTGFPGRTTCDVAQSRCYSQRANSSELLVSTVASPAPQSFSPVVQTAFSSEFCVTARGGLVVVAGRDANGNAVIERVAGDGSTGAVRLANQGPDVYLRGPVFLASTKVFVSGGYSQQIFAVPLPLGFGNSPATLFYDTTNRGGLYADDTEVFWFNGDQRQLLSCAAAGCTGIPNVRANGWAYDLTGDGQALYWLDYVGASPSRTIIKLAR